jgi:hypothetical protein
VTVFAIVWVLFVYRNDQYVPVDAWLRRRVPLLGSRA